METNQLEDLIKKYNKGQCTPEEKDWLEQWFFSFEWSRQEDFPESTVRELKETVWNNLQEKMSHTSPWQNDPVSIRSKRRRLWRYSAVAASILVVISFSTFVIYNRVKDKTSLPAGEESKASHLQVLPGSSKASLVMDNGSVVTLDSAAVTQLTTDDGTIIDKQYGTITYKNNQVATDKVSYNTLYIPRGGEFQLILPDGSKVWMNAASSLKFPTRFIEKERTVYLTGEAYFEVAKNPRQPFKVIVEKDMEVQVVGTHFNVMAYPDERAIKTTLAEGSVNIKTNTKTISLAPAQQAALNRGSRLLEVTKADIDKELAWKNGMIEFQDDDLPYIMRQLGRWYDVDISFETTVSSATYNGSIPRKALLSEVMKILSIAGIKYRMDNKKLIITGA